MLLHTASLGKGAGNRPKPLPSAELKLYGRPRPLPGTPRPLPGAPRGTVPLPGRPGLPLDHFPTTAPPEPATTHPWDRAKPRSLLRAEFTPTTVPTRILKAPPSSWALRSTPCPLLPDPGSSLRRVVSLPTGNAPHHSPCPRWKQGGSKISGAVALELGGWALTTTVATPIRPHRAKHHMLV